MKHVAVEACKHAERDEVEEGPKVKHMYTRDGMHGGGG